MTKFLSLRSSSPTTLVKEIGSFLVSSGAIRFSDPCYTNDANFKGTFPALNGNWQAKFGCFRDEIDARELLDFLHQLKYIHTSFKKLQLDEELDLWVTFSELVVNARESEPQSEITNLCKFIDQHAKEADEPTFKRLVDEVITLYENTSNNKEPTTLNGALQSEITNLCKFIDQHAKEADKTTFKRLVDEAITLYENNYKTNAANKHSGVPQPDIANLYRLIDQHKNIDERTTLKRFADEAITFFEASYVSKAVNYWDKNAWLIFQLSAAFQYQEFYFSLTDGLIENKLLKLKALLNEKSITSNDYEKLKSDIKEKSLKKIETKMSQVQKSHEVGIPRRLQFLHIKHETVSEFTPLEEKVWIQNSSFDVGVDSGQAGFFDEGWYSDFGNEKQASNRSSAWKATYQMLGQLSLGKEKMDPLTGVEEYKYSGTFKYGCNGQTAYGDGSAPLFYRMDSEGKVIEAIYHYDVTVNNLCMEN